MYEINQFIDYKNIEKLFNMISEYSLVERFNDKYFALLKIKDLKFNLFAEKLSNKLLTIKRIDFLN